MDFGRLPFNELLDVDFNLPTDGERYFEPFPRETKYHLGCPKWGFKDWNGILFPNNTKEPNLLPEYVKHFNAIELNAVSYSLPIPELIKKWYKSSSPNFKNDFLFCPKLSNIITHKKRLADVEDEIGHFLSSVSLFKKNLGPILIQMGDNFGPTNYLILEKFLGKLPSDKRFFLELRHPEWFSNNIARRQIFSLLSELNIGAVLTDTAGRRDVLHMELPIPEIFVRFVGNGSRRLIEDYTRIDDWVNRLKQWQACGLEKVYFFIHQLEVSYGIEMVNGNFSSPSMTISEGKSTLPLADYTIKQFNIHLNANLPELKVNQSNQTELF